MVAVNQNNMLAATSTAQPISKARVLSAIRQASQQSGVDFSYLVNKATQESSLNPTAKARGSSATGLYQFIDQTWLKTIKQNGEKYGLGDMADKIAVGSDGVARVANEADKKAILELRKNPEVSAQMAAELAKMNKEQLQAEVGGKIGPTELYLAHFLGAGGASDLLTAMKTDPSTKAASLLPQAANANKSVFYDKETGEAKTVAQIYKQFANKFERTPDLQGMETQIASATPAASTSQDQAALRTIQTAAAVEGVSDPTGGVTLSNGVSLGKTTTSPFAAMVLAQMDMDTFGLDAKTNTSKLEKSSDERRKSVLSTLANAA